MQKSISLKEFEILQVCFEVGDRECYGSEYSNSRLAYLKYEGYFFIVAMQSASKTCEISIVNSISRYP